MKALFRHPISQVLTLSFALGFAACNSGTENAAMADAGASVDSTAAAPSLPYKISLAQWSLHKEYFAEGANPYTFAADAKAMGFEGVEYVTQIYRKDLVDQNGKEEAHKEAIMKVIARLDSAAQAEGMTEVLIMIDAEGDLATTDEKERQKALRNHKHWIEAAGSSNIPTIRLNLGGKGNKDEKFAKAVESLKDLGAFAKTHNVNVVVENHGGHSSDPVWLRDVMAAVGMGNVGILPDFGNFCRKKEGDDWRKPCVDEVPADSTYTAVGMWMPFAHAVSAKSYNFDAQGNETKIDYQRMIDTVVAHGYTGFIGVEFEGEAPEREGIKATQALLQRVGTK